MSPRKGVAPHAACLLAVTTAVLAGGASPASSAPTRAPVEEPTLVVKSLHESATASSSTRHHAARNAMDGDPRTWWVSRGRGPAWLEVDLGSVKRVSGVRTRWGVSGTRFSITTARSDTRRIDVASGSAGRSRTAVSRFRLRRARYVRITAVAKGSGAGPVSLREVSVLGPARGRAAAKPPAVPDPSRPGVSPTAGKPGPKGDSKPTDGSTPPEGPVDPAPAPEPSPSPSPQPSPEPSPQPSPSPSPQPSPSPSPQPSPSPSPGPLNPALPAPLIDMLPGNPYTTPLPTSGVPLLASSEQESFRAELRFMVNQSTRVEQSQYSNALYIVYRNGDVYNGSGEKLAANVPFFKPSGPLAELNNGIDGRGWPIAAWMQPDPGEGTLALYNPETGRYAETAFATVRAGSMTYSWGGYSTDMRKTMGIAPYSNPRANIGANAHGNNLMSYTITDREIRAAVARYQAGDHANAYIPHVLGYEAYRHHRNQWHYPASRTDWTGTGTMTDQWCYGTPKVSQWGVGGCDNWLGNGKGILPMGGIIRLDPAINVQTQIRGDGTPFGDMMARIFARTLQKHGMTMTDATEAGVAFLAEHKRKPDNTYNRANAFSYDKDGDLGTNVWHYGTDWLKPLLLHTIDNDMLQWINTGRNLESDLNQPAAPGTYRPPR